MSQFRIIPAHTTYSGLTALAVGEGREIVVMGVGKDAERALIQKKENTK